MMTIKIDRFKLTHESYKSQRGVDIVDYLQYRTIVSIDTSNRETNEKLAKIILDELNSGKYDLGD